MIEVKGVVTQVIGPVVDISFEKTGNELPSIHDALEIIKKIIHSVKKVNGLFVSLWHNENLFEHKFENSWRNVFEQMLMEMKNGN